MIEMSGHVLGLQNLKLLTVRLLLVRNRQRPFSGTVFGRANGTDAYIANRIFRRLSPRESLRLEQSSVVAFSLVRVEELSEEQKEWKAKWKIHTIGQARNGQT